MLKVYLVPRMMNAMGTTNSPSVEVNTGERWVCDDGRLIVYNARAEKIAEFAPGQWTHILSS